MVTGLHSQEGRITQTRDHLPADNTELTSTALPGTAVYSDDLPVSESVNVKQRSRVRLSDGVTEPPRGATSASCSLFPPVLEMNILSKSIHILYVNI